MSDGREAGMERQGAGSAAEASRAAAGERGSQLAFVAHEVRNPLSTALWSAELLARISAAERGGQRGEKLAAMCQRALIRLRNLIEDHLLSERLETGGMPVEPEAVALVERLAEADSRRPATAGKLILEVGGDLLALADRFLLDRILEALLAVASAGEAPCRVAGAVAGEEVIVRFQGAAPSATGLADPLRGAPFDSSGRPLALPMARRAALAMGGSLRIEGGAYLLALPAAARASRPEDRGDGGRRADP